MSDQIRCNVRSRAARSLGENYSRGLLLPVHERSKHSSAMQQKRVCFSTQQVHHSTTASLLRCCAIVEASAEMLKHLQNCLPLEERYTLWILSNLQTRKCSELRTGHQHQQLFRARNGGKAKQDRLDRRNAIKPTYSAHYLPSQIESWCQRTKNRNDGL